MFKTIKLETSPNIGKAEKAYELVKPFQNTLSEMIVYMDKRLKMHGELPKGFARLKPKMYPNLYPQGKFKLYGLKPPKLLIPG